MAEAQQRVHEALARATTTLDCSGTIMTLARLVAMKAVKRELQAQEVKLAYVERSTIVVAANSYLREHPELIDELLGSIVSHNYVDNRPNPTGVPGKTSS